MYFIFSWSTIGIVSNSVEFPRCCTVIIRIGRIYNGRSFKDGVFEEFDRLRKCDSDDIINCIITIRPPIEGSIEDGIMSLIMFLGVIRPTSIGLNDIFAVIVGFTRNVE